MDNNPGKDYSILYRRMNPDLLKPEIQAFVNNVNIKKKALDWTLWIRQVLFLKDAWYLLLEIEPEEEFINIWWESMSEMVDNRENRYHTGAEIYHRNMRLIEIIPPIDPEIKSIYLNFHDVHRRDIRCLIQSELMEVVHENYLKKRMPDEIVRGKLLNKMDEFDLKYDIPEEISEALLLINSIRDEAEHHEDYKPEKISERLRNIFLISWYYMLDLRTMKKEKYQIKSLKADKAVKFKDIEMKLTNVKFYPEAFSVKMTVPARSPTLVYSYRKSDDEMLYPLFKNYPGDLQRMLMALGIVQNQSIALYFNHKLTGNEADIDSIAERIAIKDLRDDPDVTFFRALCGF